MDRFDPFVKYADVYGDIINWEKDPMNKPQNQNKYFFSDGKTYYEQICKMLRLMSVFKEAFNQIYSNEDEISEAWENFVNNLSASVVEGNEPDVTLTWTDDSVNFEFTMVPGVPGDPGVGITSISFNSDYTMTITLSDGNSYTSMSLKGDTGPQGPQGETGSGLQILDVYATLADLQSAHPTGQPGDAYQVGSEGSYTLYIWSSSQSAWVEAGTLGTVSPYTSAPLMDGTASAGSQNLYARGDHVHPSDTSRASKEELDALIRTSQSLIDQSFTYRESPAIQDGLARIDKIKGNTLVFNQLVNNGNFADSSGWSTVSSASLTIGNNIATITTVNAWSGLTSSTGWSLVSGHKYLFSASYKISTTNYEVNVYSGNLFDFNTIPCVADNQWHTIQQIITCVQSGQATRPSFDNRSASGSYSVKNIMLIDLTQMFGEGNEPSTVEEFTSLFPLPYYDYNAGTLLSFNGTGLKTNGINQFNGRLYSGQVTSDGRYVTASNRVTNVSAMQENTAYLHKGTYTISCQGLDYCSVLTKNEQYQIIDNYANAWNSLPFTFEATEDSYIYFTLRKSDNSNIEPNYNVQIQYGSSASDYEPYSESTLSLPVSTNFPTGMKSAGNAYDELTSSKAITRLVKYTITGTEDIYNWGQSYDNHYGGALTLPSSISGLLKGGTNTNGIASMGYTVAFVNNDMTVYLNTAADRMIIINDAFTTREQWLQGITGLEVVLELATPTETSISLELDLNFNAYENGTEQLLPVNGSVPSTSPIMADMTYLSIDDAMEYILDKLANVPENTQQILESLEDDVADLQADVGALQPAVSALQTSVGNINTNIGQLSSTVAGHTSSISDMQSDITDLNTDLGDLSDTVTDNTSRIGTLETGLSSTNGNVQSLSNQVQSIDGRVTNLESDLFKIVVKEFDYETVASETNFGVTTPITQEEGYRIIGVVGTEAQAGENTSPASNIAITQCHIHYTSLGAVSLTIFGRNNGASSRTNVRIYAYLLCIKDIQ